MLIQFSVENFRSFKGKAILSLIPSKDTNHESNLSEITLSERVLNSIAIYGANAAGKTNLFKALTSAILLIRLSNQRQKNDILPGITPFIFDENMKEKPTCFEFVFETGDVKYIYGFSANQVEILDEYLYAYFSSKPSTIFERSGNEYKFPRDKRMLDQIAEKNTPNKLFLSTATAWNYERTEAPNNWFATGINTYPDYEQMQNTSLELYEKEDKQKIHDFTLELLRESDINIDDYHIKDAKVMDAKKHNIFMDHLVTREDGSTGKITLNLNDESRGTGNIFMLAPILRRALKNGETVVIDEIERSLHPLLVKNIIAYFNDAERNPNHAQLIFNTHNLELMSLDIFRRDQIYFVDKSIKTGESELYSLDEFSVRTEENIRKGYLLGRYGALPSILEGLSR
ncbi:MAG: ATP-binding protein [Eubacteriales bacterium]|jgi:AAA15 family ATPase/GTPase|nr:ATP-binding protein [Eubacteriales bacterium]MDD4429365.1 ATP-binding protein [Paludibacter sp.]